MVYERSGISVIALILKNRILNVGNSKVKNLFILLKDRGQVKKVKGRWVFQNLKIDLTCTHLCNKNVYWL